MAIDLIQLLTYVVFTIDILAALWIVFVERRDPANATPWILVLLLLPFLGFVLYILFGQHYFSERQFAVKADKDKEAMEKKFLEQVKGIDDWKSEHDDPEMEPYVNLVEMLLRSNQAFLSINNEVKLYVRGVDKFDALLEAIRNAKQFIHMEYYIIRNDELGNKVIDALVEKAKEGVEVRFLVDALGNKIPKKKYQVLRSAGGKVAVFYKTIIPGLSVRLNYHDHRKIAVIDGEVGFLGGFNIGDEYLGKGPLGWWRDSAVEIHGDAVKSLNLRFFLDWNHATKGELNDDRKYLPDAPSEGASRIQIVNGGPDTRWDPIKDEYLKLIGAARKSIYLQTPYFIPDQAISDALRTAALSGLDVRIMIPDKPDHPFVFWASYSYVGELLKAGVKAYKYDNGFIHAKTVTVDDIASSVGTGNWDIRSFRLNFETNAVIYDKEFARQMRLAYEEDMKKSTEVTKELYEGRSNWIKFKESISRFFSPVI